MRLKFRDRNIFTTSGQTYEHIDGDGELIYYHVKKTRGKDDSMIVSGKMEVFSLDITEESWFIST